MAQNRPETDLSAGHRRLNGRAGGVPAADFRGVGARLVVWTAMVVLMEAYDDGVPITMTHANSINAHRGELESYREQRARPRC